VGRRSASYGSVEQGLEPSFEPRAELARMGHGSRGGVAGQLVQVGEARCEEFPQPVPQDSEGQPGAISTNLL
jgi:hypothetical protein